MNRATVAPPRPISPGDIVVGYSPALGEWAAAQVTDLDSSWGGGAAGVLDLDWSGPEPASVDDLGALVPLRLTHHAHAGRLSHCNFDWLLPRGCRVVGNVPLLYDQRSNTYSSGWRLGSQLALQRCWDRGERFTEQPGSRSFRGAEIAGLTAGGVTFPELWDVTIGEIETLDCNVLVALFPNVVYLSVSGLLGTLITRASSTGSPG